MKKKTCFVIYVAYRMFGKSDTRVKYICSTEENAKAKLEDAVNYSIIDLQEQIESYHREYHPECLMRVKNDFCVNLKYILFDNMLEYNIYYNEIEMD